MRKRIFSVFFTFGLGAAAVSAQSLQDGLRAIEFEKYEHAKEIFTRLIEQSPASPEYYYYLGQAYTASFQESSAEEIYRKGTAAASGGLNYAGLGELKIREDRLQEAEAFFTQALTFDRGRDIPTLRAISRGYLAAGDVYADKALEYANKAMELNRKDMENYMLLGDVYLEKLDGGKAATNYEKSIEVNPKDPRPYVKVANIWLRLKNVEATLGALNKAIELDPEYAPAHKTFAKLYYMAKQFDKAKVSYNKYLDLSERSSANQRQFVNILFLGGAYKDALEITEEILKADQQDIYLYRLKAYSIYETGIADKIDRVDFYQDGILAIDTFLARIEEEKVLPSDYAYKGKLLSKTGQDSLAISTMLLSLEIDSSDIEVYNEIAKVKNKMRRYDDAAVYFQTYIDKKARPTVVDYYYVARAYYYSKQYGKADTAYIKLLELRPDYAEAYFSRGNTNALLDPEYKDTVARSMFEQYILMAEADSLKNKNNLIDAYTYLAIYAVKKDDNETAKLYFTKILALDPENKTASEALKQLRQ